MFQWRYAGVVLALVVATACADNGIDAELSCDTDATSEWPTVTLVTDDPLEMTVWCDIAAAGPNPTWSADADVATGTATGTGDEAFCAALASGAEPRCETYVPRR